MSKQTGPTHINFDPVDLSEDDDNSKKSGWNFRYIAMAIKRLQDNLSQLWDTVNTLTRSPTQIYLAPLWSIAGKPYLVNDVVVEVVSGTAYYFVSNIAANNDQPSTNYTPTPGTAGFSWTRYTTHAKLVKVILDIETGQTPGV